MWNRDPKFGLRGYPGAIGDMNAEEITQNAQQLLMQGKILTMKM